MSILINQVPTNFSQKLLFNKNVWPNNGSLLNDISYNILNGWGTAAGIVNLAGELCLSLFWFVEVICRWITFHIFLYFLIYLFPLISISTCAFFLHVRFWNVVTLWNFLFQIPWYFWEKNPNLGRKTPDSSHGSNR
jgi:hypothetical protein